MTPREVSLMAMDVKAARKVAAPQLLDFVEDFNNGWGESLAPDQLAARRKEFAPLLAIMRDLLPFLHKITSNAFLSLADVNELGLLIDRARALVARCNFSLSLASQLEQLFSFWSAHMTSWFGIAKEYLEKSGLGYVSDLLRVRALRFTQDFLEQMHGVFRGQGANQAVGLESVAAQAKAFNSASADVSGRQRKDVKQAVSASKSLKRKQKFIVAQKAADEERD
jgi:hypothetical protein